jgi:hypothetical protein
VHMTTTPKPTEPITRRVTIKGHTLESTEYPTGRVGVLCTTHPDVTITRTPILPKRALAAMREHVNGASPKVSADGTVTLTGKVIGKVERTTKDTSIYAAIGGHDGPVRWYPCKPDGTHLSDYVETRQRAVNIVAEWAKPTTFTSISREHGWYSDDDFISGYLHYEGHTMGLSRYPGEAAWVVDSLTPRGAFCPHFANGPGSRCTRNQVITDSSLIEIVNASVLDHFRDDAYDASWIKG